MSNEQIWAPWRLSYIKADKSPKPGCFLCEYRDDDQDAENLVVLRGTTSFVVMNRFPYNNGHLLVAPLAHKASLQELEDDELLECGKQLQQMTKLLAELMQPQGFNVGLNLGECAGAGLPGHLHWHIVPRWSGDTNFMPVISDTNVIPQALTALYELLRGRVSSSSA